MPYAHYYRAFGPAVSSDIPFCCSAMFFKALHGDACTTCISVETESSASTILFFIGLFQTKKLICPCRTTNLDEVLGVPFFFFRDLLVGSA